MRESEDCDDRRRLFLRKFTENPLGKMVAGDKLILEKKIIFS
jgi:hypothetical protein